MKKNAALFFLISIFTLFSCIGGIKIPEAKQEYIGIWSCQKPQIYLKIEANGKIEFKYKNNGTSKSISAPIQKFHGNDFEVGAMGMKTVFKVSKVPYEENEEWKMVVDDHVLIKSSR